MDMIINATPWTIDKIRYHDGKRVSVRLNNEVVPVAGFLKILSCGQWIQLSTPNFGVIVEFKPKRIQFLEVLENIQLTFDF